MMQRLKELQAVCIMCRTKKQEAELRLCRFVNALNCSWNFNIPTPEPDCLTVQYPIGTDKEGNEWEVSIESPLECIGYFCAVDIMPFKKQPGESEFVLTSVGEWGYIESRRFGGTTSCKDVEDVAKEINWLKSLVSGVEVSSV
tara:strand:+ start:1824 stop:2252 length:429 start_codon:yes stop_codon:yes gene_type:complete